MPGVGVKIQNGYALKAPSNGKHADVARVVEELLRVANCRHVEAPQEPVMLAGDPEQIKQLPDLLERGAEAQTDASGNRQRNTTPVLMTSIYSYPTKTAELAGDPHFDTWKRLVLEDARRDYGKDAIVVLHLDEGHPNIHVLAHKGGAPVKSLHYGLKAKAEGGSYKDAMTAMLDRFYDQVGKYCGMTRHGPGKRSLTRPAWHAEQQQAKATAKALQEAAQQLAEARTQLRDVKAAQTSVGADKTALAMQRAMLEQEQREIRARRAELAKIDAEAQAALKTAQEADKAARARQPDAWEIIDGKNERIDALEALLRKAGINPSSAKMDGAKPSAP